MKTTLTNGQLVKSLFSVLCPACGASKHSSKTFCPSCYGKLPAHQKKALYFLLGSGYTEAVTAAFCTLRVKSPRLPTDGGAA